MSQQYLFDSEGRWIAFIDGKNVFDNNKRWVGWFPWSGNDILTPNNEYLGTIVQGNRLYKFTDREHKQPPGIPESPDIPPDVPKHPGVGGVAPLPANAVDVELG